MSDNCAHQVNGRCPQCKPPEPSSAREWWIRREDYSNRALIRDDSEKWPDDVNGRPSSAWERVIEYSAFEQMRKERDEAKAEWESMNITAGMYSLEADRYREALERIETEDNGWAGFEAAKALAKEKSE
jgi:hypothetical protein